MDKVLQIIQKKSPLFSFAAVGYLVLAGFLKWRLTPEMGAVWFLVGGAVGIYFLDIAEAFFSLSPSPFRTVVFAGAFSLVSVFVVTSSGSFLTTGLVLSLYLSLILWQIGQWQIQGNNNEWYRMTAGPVDIKTQRWVLLGFIALFVVETFLFIR